MTTRLEIRQITNYSLQAFDPPIDLISFAWGVTATFSAAQVPASILPSVTIEGAAHKPNAILFKMGAALTFSAEAFTIGDWDPEDRFIIQGDDDPETITGSSVRDEISGNSGNDQIIGSGGGDVQNGGAGFDSFVYTHWSQARDDTVNGGPDDDIVWVQGNGNYQLTAMTDVQRLLIAPFSKGQQTDVSVTCKMASLGGDGIREIHLCSGVRQELVIEGTAIDLKGVTFFDYDPANHKIVLSAATSNRSQVKIAGTAMSEEIRGSASADQLAGNGGDDVIVPGGGAQDVCAGGAGNDTFLFRSGDRSLESLLIDGGAGTKDRLACGTDFSSRSSAISGIEIVEFTAGCTVSLETAFFVPDGRSAIGDIFGSKGADTLKISGSGWNTIDLGKLGLRNWSASDAIVMQGSGGGETLRASLSRDVITGGGSADRFVFTAGSSKPGAWHDLITDFTAGTDVIDLSGIDANGEAAGNQAFRAVTAFTGDAGQLRISSAGGNTWLICDINGDTRPDLQIELAGAIRLSPGSDIIL